ncbi:hypothetical protein ACWXWU_05215 [Shewanella sp. A14]
MNSVIFVSVINARSQIINQAILNVDVDIDAERLVVLDRVYLTTLVNKQIAASTFKIMLPSKYMIDSNLLVGIIDDDGEYNCQFIDGVSAEVIDGNAEYRV